MIVNKITEAVIYTDNAGAETIYIKESGDKEPKVADQKRSFDLHAQLMENKLWGDIRRAARTNPTLKRALDEAIMIYNLSK